MDSLTIDTRRPEDDRALDGLYAEVFGQPLAEGSRRRWHWQYLENPSAGSGSTAIWVARDGDQILGQYASMPVRLWWGEREVESSWGMDVFVRAEARGRGVGAQLFTTWASHVNVALGLGLTPSSYGLFLKLGYADVGPVPFFVKVLDASAVAARRLRQPLGHLVGPPLGFVLGLLDRSPRASLDAPVITRVADLDAGYDDLWERVRGSFAMCVRRDRAYLDWKYVRCPHRRYDLWEARREGTLVGYAVSRHELYRGLRIGWLVDVFADVGDASARTALVGHVLQDFREAGVARAQAFAMHGALGATLRQSGFLRGRSPMQFCVHSQTPSDPVLRDDQLERWHVVFGDSDMDR